MDIGTLKIVFITVILGVLLFLSIWFYRKLKNQWYRKGLDDANEDCNKRLIQVHNLIASGELPVGMSESRKTWRMPSNESSDTVESTNTDGSGQQATTGEVPK